MKTLSYSLTLCLLLICGVCRAQVQKTEQQKKMEEIFLPDSMLTRDQLVMKVRVAELIMDKIEVKDGSVTTSLKEKDFEKNDIPVYYHKMLLDNIEAVNGWIAEGKCDAQELNVRLKEGFDKAKEHVKVLKRRLQEENGD